MSGWLRAHKGAVCSREVAPVCLSPSPFPRKPALEGTRAILGISPHLVINWGCGLLTLAGWEGQAWVLQREMLNGSRNALYREHSVNNTSRDDAHGLFHCPLSPTQP